MRNLKKKKKHLINETKQKETHRFKELIDGSQKAAGRRWVKKGERIKEHESPGIKQRGHEGEGAARGRGRERGRPGAVPAGRPSARRLCRVCKVNHRAVRLRLIHCSLSSVANNGLKNKIQRRKASILASTTPEFLRTNLKKKTHTIYTENVRRSPKETEDLTKRRHRARTWTGSFFTVNA